MDVIIALICCWSNVNIYFIIRQLLGVCYQYATGVVKDEVEAVKYYKMAADQGNADAQYNIGEAWIRVYRCCVAYRI